ncbi:MAG: hypothetical protein V4736_13945 [Bdellovibrionota bacterium]
MSLENYFSSLIKRVEDSDIDNQGKDKNGFFKPTRTILLRHLNLIKDLHQKPNAKGMVKASWAKVVEELPPEWLILSEEEKKELKNILG